MIKTKLVGVDFDNTLVEGAKPVAGARDAMSRLHELGYKIIIFSCNRTSWIERCLRDNDIFYDYIWEGDKPNLDFYIDDRAITFKGDWPNVIRQITGDAQRTGEEVV